MFEFIDDHLRKIRRNGLLPAGIIITGGGSALNSIDDLAKSALKLPARIGSMSTIDGKSTFKDNSLAVAYGLCIWGLHADEAPEIDPTVDFFKNLWKRINRLVKQFLP
jgi:cell division protein FtsA